jgi:putative endonuclease
MELVGNGRHARAGGAGRPGRQEIGARGEDLAVAELQRQGMDVLARNWRCAIGEIDVVAVETANGRQTLVFCEVKCRTGLGFGAPLESITYAKLRKLRQLAAQWLATEQAHADGIRIDAIGVVLRPGAPPELTHVRGIG